MFHGIKTDSKTAGFTLKCNNIALANSLRRIVSEVPSIAFTETVVEPREESRARLIEHPEKIALNIAYSPIPDIDADQIVRHGASLYLTINATNDSTDDIDITSDDIKYVFNGEAVKPKKNTLPHHFYTLRPNQALHLKSEVTVGKCIENACYEHGKWIKYLPKYSDSSEFKGEVYMRFKTFGVYDPKKVIKYACEAMVAKIDRVIKYIIKDDKEESKADKNVLMVMLEGENDTIANLVISDIIDKTEYAAYKMNRYAGKELTLEVRAKDPKRVLIESLEGFHKTFTKMASQL
jgi:DNA-directed RNA polymerase subunit L